MADVLPGFAWERNTARYRDLSTGRWVSRNTVNDLLEAQVNSLERRLGNLVTAAHEGRIASGWFAETMRTELRRAHLQQRALGAGGINRLDQSAYGSVGRKLRDDYARVSRLADDIANGRVSLPQALNRINGYAGNARLEYFEANRIAQRQAAQNRGMTLLMIRDLGASEHCVSCVEYHSQGWQLDLPAPGTQSECGTHCRCSMRYREVPFEQVDSYLGTRR